MAEKDKPALQLLKLHFGKGKDGEWEIKNLFGMTLRPSVGSDSHFFRIANDLVTQQPSLFGTTTSILGQSVVPLVAHVPGERVLRCLGTGFFVSCSGLLITAAHVVSDPIERQYGGVRELDDRAWQLGNLKLGVMIAINPLTEGVGYIFRDIEWAAFLGERAERPLPIAGVRLKLTSDVAICKVSQIAEGIPHQPLAIVQPGLVGVGLGVGKNAVAIGYGEMHDVELMQQSERVVSGNLSFHLNASAGTITERFPDNLTERQVPTPGPCFSAALQLPPGMSGSPIFDHEGIYVHGVVSRGWSDESGPARFGFGCMLAPLLGIPIKPLGNRTLLELRASGTHGFPRLQGPGL